MTHEIRSIPNMNKFCNWIADTKLSLSVCLSLVPQKYVSIVYCLVLQQSTNDKGLFI